MLGDHYETVVFSGGPCLLMEKEAVLVSLSVNNYSGNQIGRIFWNAFHATDLVHASRQQQTVFKKVHYYKRRLTYTTHHAYATSESK